jgi:hypothetical protein
MPGAHEDGKPADANDFAAIAARQKRKYHTEGQCKVIERPNSQDAPNIELFDPDGTGNLALTNQ